MAAAVNCLKRSQVGLPVDIMIAIEISPMENLVVQQIKVIAEELRYGGNIVDVQ